MRWRFKDPEGSFWEKVDRSGGENDCWEWTAAIDSNGYGALKVSGKKVNAHRYSLELLLGRPLQSGMDACHTCHNRSCVNPAHLYEGTRKQNVVDAIQIGTHTLPPPDKRLRGEANPDSFLTEQEVLDIYRRAWSGERQTKIAAEYGIKKSLVTKIKHGLSWRHVTHHRD